MIRPFKFSRANSLNGLALATWSWVFGYALPVLAQKQATGQVVAAEIKGLPTHENSGFLEAMFTTINYLTGIALAGALIFGLIWLLQRRNVVDVVTKDASADPSDEASDATKETTTANAENADAAEKTELTEKTENTESSKETEENKDDEKAVD